MGDRLAVHVEVVVHDLHLPLAVVGTLALHRMAALVVQGLAVLDEVDFNRTDLVDLSKILFAEVERCV